MQLDLRLTPFWLLIIAILLTSTSTVLADCGERHEATVPPGGSHTFVLNDCFCGDPKNVQKVAENLVTTLISIAEKLKALNLPLDGSLFTFDIPASERKLYAKVVLHGDFPGAFGKGPVSFTHKVGVYTHSCIGKAAFVAEVRRALNVAIAQL